MPDATPLLLRSWDGRTELHPFGRFPLEPNQATHFILGSFPPNRFTVYPENRVQGDADFFYGSRDNAFWSLFIGACRLAFRWPDDLVDLKHWLACNRWVVSDIIKTTVRKKNSAADSDLLPVEWNIQAIDQILRENPVQKILFTSNWVKRNFEQKVKPFLTAYGGNYQELVLMSPSPAGLISTGWAQALLPKRTGEGLTDYRLRYYQWALSQHA